MQSPEHETEGRLNHPYDVVEKNTFIDFKKSDSESESLLRKIKLKSAPSILESNLNQSSDSESETGSISTDEPDPNISRKFSMTTSEGPPDDSDRDYSKVPGKPEAQADQGFAENHQPNQFEKPNDSTPTSIASQTHLPHVIVKNNFVDFEKSDSESLLRKIKSTPAIIEPNKSERNKDYYGEVPDEPKAHAKPDCNQLPVVCLDLLQKKEYGKFIDAYLHATSSSFGTATPSISTVSEPSSQNLPQPEKRDRSEYNRLRWYRYNSRKKNLNRK